jgi:hypothetical protein
MAKYRIMILSMLLALSPVCMALTFNDIQGDYGNYSSTESFTDLGDNNITGHTTNGWSFRTATASGNPSMGAVKIAKGAGSSTVYTTNSNDIDLFNFITFTLVVSGDLTKSGTGGTAPSYTLTGNRSGYFFIEQSKNVVPVGTSVNFYAKESIHSSHTNAGSKTSNWSISPNPYKVNGIHYTPPSHDGKTSLNLGGTWSAPDKGVYTITAHASPLTNPGNSSKATAELIVAELKITINKNTFALKHDRDATVTITTDPPVAATYLSDYEIEIAKSGSNSWLSLNTGNDTYDWKTVIAGQFKLRAKAKLDGTNIISSNELTVTVAFPNYSQIIADATVLASMNAEWQATLNDCTANPNRNRERGFWITIDTNKNTYNVTGSTTGSWNYPPDGASIDLGNRPGVKLSTPAVNASGAVYAVASFHTHPPSTYYPINLARYTGPSDQDISTDISYNVAGIVYDYSAADISGGHSKYDPAKLYPARNRRLLTAE